MTPLCFTLMFLLPMALFADGELYREFKLRVQTGEACECSYPYCKECYDDGGSNGYVKTVLYGEKGKSEAIPLDNWGDDRVQNQVDTYEISVDKDIGVITGLAFEHWRSAIYPNDSYLETATTLNEM